jgi:hypothetical protein
MQITKLVPPINGLFSGDAISTRGRRYKFTSTPEGEVDCQRESWKFPMADGRSIWDVNITPPPALVRAVREAVRS